MSQNGILAAQEPAGPVDNASRDKWAVCPCGVHFWRTREKRLFCSDRCRNRAWVSKHPRQRSLFDARPVPPVQDQRVPRRERRKLTRMSRAILDRLEKGHVTATEIHCMFPGARSVRTRISDVTCWLRAEVLAGRDSRVLKSRALSGTVGEWLYWLEEP